MADENADDLRSRSELVANGLLPFLHQPAARDGKRSRRADAEHVDLVVLVLRLEIVANPSPITLERLENTSEGVVQRNVMIAGNDDFGETDGGEKLARLLELTRPRPHRQISGDRDEIGLDRFDRFRERVDG